MPRPIIRLALTATLGALAFAGCGQTDTEPAKPDRPAAVVTIDAEVLVDRIAATRPKWIKTACDGYDLLGHEFGLAQFKNGYGDGPPSAKQVWNELITRCD